MCRAQCGAGQPHGRLHKRKKQKHTQAEGKGSARLGSALPRSALLLSSGQLRSALRALQNSINGIHGMPSIQDPSGIHPECIACIACTIKCTQLRTSGGQPHGTNSSPNGPQTRSQIHKSDAHRIAGHGPSPNIIKYDAMHLIGVGVGVGGLGVRPRELLLVLLLSLSSAARCSRLRTVVFVVGVGFAASAVTSKTGTPVGSLSIDCCCSRMASPPG